MEMINRYFIFMFSDLRPLGGWHDFKGAYTDIGWLIADFEQFKQFTIDCFGVFQIVDVYEGKIVFEYNFYPHKGTLPTKEECFNELKEFTRIYTTTKKWLT